MSGEQRIDVERAELKEAVKWTRRGREAQHDLFVLFKDSQSFKVRSEFSEVSLKSSGSWHHAIAVDAGTLKRLVDKLPRAKDVTIEFEDGQLKVGPTGAANACRGVNTEVRHKRRDHNFANRKRAREWAPYATIFNAAGDPVSMTPPLHHAKGHDPERK